MSNDPLTALEQDAIHVIRDAYARLDPHGMLWSLGKDPDTMLHAPWRIASNVQ